MTSANPFATAAQRLNAFVNLDTSLAEKLADLSRRQSRDTKLAYAYESGRLFALRKMHAEMQQQRSLNTDLKSHPPTVESY